MSITVEDVMALPSMRGAKVLGGHGGLLHTVSSISVLESTDPKDLNKEVFKNPDARDNEVYSSELVISGFVNIRNDVELQCANIRRLAEGGEIGMILYYVGAYVPKVDSRLINLANELDFVLICMPENRVDLRYSEVMGEVWEAIIRDRMAAGSLVSEILERVSRLAPHQRTIDTVLKMLSDRIHTTIILTDTALHILNEVVWPRTMEFNFGHGLERALLPTSYDQPVAYSGLRDCLLYRCELSGDRGQTMNLLLFREGGRLSTEVLRQTEELMQLALNIWGQSHDEVAVRELVRAILRDEPLKMKRLGDIFQIDVASMHTMWVLCDPSPERLSGILAGVLKLLTDHCRIAFGDIYENALVVFIEGPDSLGERAQLSEELMELINSPSTRLTMCPDLRNPTEVQRAFLKNQSGIWDACKLFPLRKSFYYGEVQFAEQCRKLVEGGLAASLEASAPLSSLTNIGEGGDLLKTLEVYMLDGEMNISKTAELMYLHKNTIKYRISKISDILGFKPDKMPEAFELYRGVAVSRLME